MKHGGRWAVCVFAIGIAAVVYGIVPGPSPDVLTFSNGGSFVGATRAGRAHGYGVYTRPDGSRHEGEWRDGKANGYGVHYLAPGDRSADRIVAEWIYGKLTFPVRRIDRYEGEWRNGELARLLHKPKDPLLPRSSREQTPRKPVIPAQAGIQRFS